MNRQFVREATNDRYAINISENVNADEVHQNDSLIFTYSKNRIYCSYKDDIVLVIWIFL